MESCTSGDLRYFSCEREGEAPNRSEVLKEICVTTFMRKKEGARKREREREREAPKRNEVFFMFLIRAQIERN